MPSTKIYLHYEPRLYSDLIQQLFTSIGQEVILGNGISEAAQPQEQTNQQESNEIMLLSLENAGDLAENPLAKRMTRAKVIAFSPDGEFGYRRLPGETSWEELRPFGLAELLTEVLS